MRKQINTRLDECSMALERALLGVKHLKQIHQAHNPKNKHDTILDFYAESLIQSQSKISVANDQLKIIKDDLDKMVTSHDQIR